MMTDFDLDKALRETYGEALRTMLKRNKEFLRKWQDVKTGKKQPPQFYTDNGLQEQWRNGYLNELARQYGISQQIMQELERAGGKAVNHIRKQMWTEYGLGYQGELMKIVNGAYKAGLVMQPVVDKRAVEIAVDDAQVYSPMSKIRFEELGRNTQVRRRLQRQLGAAIASGQGRRELMKRIINVVGNAEYNAKRTAQTELNRVRNQSHYEADIYAEQAYGLEMEREWICRFVNSRDGHMAADGTRAVRAMQGSGADDEESGWWVAGEFLRYPGDPHGSAWNVINCHCQTESRLVTDSPAMRALRERNKARREAWLAQNRQHNKDEQNWRRGQNGVEKAHPYARPSAIMSSLGSDARKSIVISSNKRAMREQMLNYVNDVSEKRNLRQQDRLILEATPNECDYVCIKSDEADMYTLAALTRVTGNEYASFAGNGLKYIVRGGKGLWQINGELYDIIYDNQLRWQCHSHPTTKNLQPSDDDRDTLRNVFTWQRKSSIIDMEGNVIQFTANRFDNT